MSFFDLFKRHKIVEQKWLDDTTVWMDCTCGGSIVLKDAKRVLLRADGMIPIGYCIQGRVHSSSCRKQPVSEPAPEEPEPTLPPARVVR